MAPGNTSPPAAEVAAAIAEATTSAGFFQLVNHGADPFLMERMNAAMHTFFGLPLEEKLQVRRSAENAMGFAHDELTKQTRDLKEVFDFCRVPHPELPEDHPSNRTIDGYNRWPAGQPEFHAAMRAYYAEMERCSFRLLEAFCLGLGLPPSALHHLFQGQHTSFLRLNYYPVHPELEGGQQAQQAEHAEQQAQHAEQQARQQEAGQAEGGQQAEQLGVNHHTDAGFLTILVQDEVPGLQMLDSEGRWQLVEPIPGALTINVGDQAQVLSNDRYKAPLHRVQASRGRRRYSVPFFFNPRPDADIAPLTVQLTDGQNPPAYRPIN